MSKTIRYKLSAEQFRAALEFSNQVGMPLEQMAKQCLFYAINDATRRAEELRKAQESVADTDSPLENSAEEGVTDAGGTTLEHTEAPLDSQAGDSNLLADTGSNDATT